MSKTPKRSLHVCTSPIPWHPIPFSGDVLCARVLTVGVNPSATEITTGRVSVQRDARGLEHHLVNYFRGRNRYEWFETWEEALTALGLSYREGAAHLDLSPRATKSMRNFADAEGANLFTEVLETDVYKLFELLTHCRSAQALLLAIYK